MKGAEGGTALFWAAKCREEDVVGVLAEEGAVVNTRNAAGENPLTVALETRHPPTVAKLLEHGHIITEAHLLQAVSFIPCRVNIQSSVPPNASLANVSNALEILQMICTHKAQLHCQHVNDNGDTALLQSLRSWKEGNSSTKVSQEVSMSFGNSVTRN